MEQYIFQVKDWYILNGIKIFIWGFITYSDKPNRDFAKCSDGKIREVHELEEINL